MNNNPYPIDWHRLLRGVLVGVLIGEAVTLVLLFLFSCMMAFVHLPLAAADWMSSGALVIGAAAGGFLSAVISKANGLLTGLLCGVVLCVLLILLSLVFHPFEATTFFLLKVTLSLIFSAIGGILGVNRKQRKRKY